MFDPTGQLPRDPINVVLDLEGAAKTFVNFLDEAALEELDGPPGEISALTLKELLLTFGGAELSGEGAVEFINEGSAFGPGIPQPVGAITLNLMGGFGLVDKLVAMGLIPAEDGQMAKMMSGMIAKPVGDDELVSELEFTADGGIKANGLPLPF